MASRTRMTVPRSGSAARSRLVSRTVHPVVPPRVEYELTSLGRTLLGTVCALMSWTVEHLDDIDRARREYDARHADQH